MDYSIPTSSISKIMTELAGILSRAVSPYPNSGGTTNCHLEPTFILGMAICHAVINPPNRKVAGLVFVSSNTVPSTSVPR